jgi:hypothetical protein
LLSKCTAVPSDAIIRIDKIQEGSVGIYAANTIWVTAAVEF